LSALSSAQSLERCRCCCAIAIPIRTWWSNGWGNHCNVLRNSPALRSVPGRQRRFNSVALTSVVGARADVKRASPKRRYDPKRASHSVLWRCLANVYPKALAVIIGGQAHHVLKDFSKRPGTFIADGPGNLIDGLAGEFKQFARFTDAKMLVVLGRVESGRFSKSAAERFVPQARR
jgi:hypothetical protein